MANAEFPKIPLEIVEEKFLSNSGGADDPDSLRGFGSTEQWWRITTTDGFIVAYGDNGSGIQEYSSPSGRKYTRVNYGYELRFEDFREALPEELGWL